MKGLVFCLMIAATPACALTMEPLAMETQTMEAGAIPAGQAWNHFGESVTVEGRLSVQRMPSGEIYLDLDGSGDQSPLSAYIPRRYAGRFAGIGALNGRRVTISGDIGSFRYRPEIFLTNPDQIAAIADKYPAGNKPVATITILGN